MKLALQSHLLFSGLRPDIFSRYSFPAAAKSAAGRRNPSYLLATPDAPCVFFYVVAQAHPFFGCGAYTLAPFR
ncbi:ash family protein [Escherichia coli]|nr:ash family protein [Escherichia coli]EFC9353468.1 ash family protein [Escherichia coli]EFT6338586.1 ash family protein [Escherichia coli]EJK8724279.1 ash family protein [Escherichia coli]EJK8965627.1 ash family protein [Escherichia coli]